MKKESIFRFLFLFFQKKIAGNGHVPSLFLCAFIYFCFIYIKEKSYVKKGGRK